MVLAIRVFYAMSEKLSRKRKEGFILYWDTVLLERNLATSGRVDRVWLWRVYKEYQATSFIPFYMTSARI